MTDAEEDITAAELALGVLDGEERAAAMRRVLAEPGFAREVERWREHFGGLFAQWPEEEPPAHLGGRVQASVSPAGAPRRFWPALAMAASAIAAVLAGIIVFRPAQVAPPVIPMQSAAPTLVASLAPAKPGTTPVPAFYDSGRHEIYVAAAALVPSGRSAELWLIPADGVPRSLGVLAGGTRTSVKLSSEQRALVDANAVLAVTDEPLGGSPSGKPTGPVVASGSLIPV
ncbi:anti-sigma factor [Novosphingobium sp. PS1R-30]|uniref:Regulator of SigK n=1 Tax=Novosphingobium anseongense TaxID=3133436 RepID=A0ABU8S2M5_9SPHN